MASLLLINPPLPRGRRAGVLGAAAGFSPPLGLLSLAACARAAGHRVAVLDAEALGLKLKAAAKEALEFRPALAGLTATTLSLSSAAALAALLKEGSPGTLVAVGGPHATALPEDTLARYPAFDLAVVGEGEETLLELLSVLDEGGWRRAAGAPWDGEVAARFGRVAGIALRVGRGEPERTAPREAIPDLDRLPRPAWDLLDGFPWRYRLQAQSWFATPSTSVCGSRGCAGRCTFCCRGVFGRRVRAHSPEYLVAALRELKCRFGVRGVQFEDDNFTLLRPRLLRFCELARAERLGVEWSCQARVDTVDPEMLKAARLAGCRAVLFGVESADPAVLEILGKRITPDRAYLALSWARAAGLATKGFFMFGCPGETRDGLGRTVEFMLRAPLDDISIHMYTPFPGTELYPNISRYGEFTPDFERMNSFEPVFVPHGLSREELLAWARRAYRAFYLRPRTVLGYMGRLKHPAQALALARSALGLARFVTGRGGEGGAPPGAHGDGSGGAERGAGR
ncbi:MAG: B12-binding domain-containing radical SAM protein [Acetobacteraceae bacterium]|nr:B12-binding domain-containing radical SAM protein [Acetobacteraceae bacterium]